MSKYRLPKIRKYEDAVNYFSTHQRVKGYNMEAKRTHAISWNCDGTKIVCGSSDRRISLASFDPSGRLTLSSAMLAHQDSVDQVFHDKVPTGIGGIRPKNVAFQHENANIFASASTDRSVCIWDVRNTKTHTKLTTKSPNLFVTWSYCGQYIIYGDKDDKLHVVDSRNLQALKVYDPKTDSNEFVCHPSGKHIFCATGNGKVEIMSIPDLTPVRTIQAHSSQTVCLSLAISKDGSRFAIGGNDALCSLWDLDELICYNTISRLDYPIRSVSYSCDGQLIAIGSEDQTLDIAWVEDGRRVVDVRTDGEVFSVAWHPKQHLLAYTFDSNNDRERFNIKLFGFTSS